MTPGTLVFHGPWNDNDPPGFRSCQVRVALVRGETSARYVELTRTGTVDGTMELQHLDKFVVYRSADDLRDPAMSSNAMWDQAWDPENPLDDG